MHFPTLVELPPPPPGRSDWPWTEESPQLPDAMRDGSLWPRVSIVTPSYNQAQFIEETIRSVLLQGYPNLEYIIIDGGSTDGSVEIIRKYEPWLAYWVSERDRGQSHAINKGFSRSTGEIVAWLNSDDTYEQNAFVSVATTFYEQPQAAIVYGKLAVIDTAGNVLTTMGGDFSRSKLIQFWKGYPGISQPASFFHRRLLQSIGMLNERLHFIMDYEYYLRAANEVEFVFTDELLARFRLQDASKTSSGWRHFIKEYTEIAPSYIRDGVVTESSMLLRDLRKYYAGLLIGCALENAQVDANHALRSSIQAVRYDPELLKQGWIRKLLLKLTLGPNLTHKLQHMRMRNL